jgi:hypothetical protein
MLAFTSVYFFESGLFNGLRPFGVKKSPRSISPIRFRAQRVAKVGLAAAHREKSGLPSGKVYGEIADPPRICWLQPARGGRKAQARQCLGVRKANAESPEERLSCGARLGERALAATLPQVDARSTVFAVIQVNYPRLNAGSASSPAQCAAQLANTHHLPLTMPSVVVRHPVETHHIGLANRASTAAK